MRDKFNEAMEYIAGSCLMSSDVALETVLGRTPTQEESDSFVLFLEDNGCYECEMCGWFTHPGESCECEDECLECGNLMGECTCE